MSQSVTETVPCSVVLMWYVYR